MKTWNYTWPQVVMAASERSTLRKEIMLHQGTKSLINQLKLVRKTDSPGRLITKNKRERQTDILVLARSFFTRVPRS